MERSETIAALAAALAAYNAEVNNPAKAKTGRVKSEKANYSYGYADLAGVLEAIREPLARNGLSVVQELTIEERRAGAATMILHESGEYLSFAPVWMPAGGTPQQYGSAITYARRISLMAAAGVAPADDDDGAAAGDAHRAAPPAPPRISAEQVVSALDLKRAAGVSDDELDAVLLKRYRAGTIDALTAAQGADLIRRLTERAAAAADPVTGEVAADPEPAPAPEDPPADLGDDDPALWPGDGPPEDPPGMDAEAFRAKTGAGGATEPNPAPGGAPATPSGPRATNPQKQAIGRIRKQLAAAGAADPTDEVLAAAGASGASELSKEQASDLLDRLIPLAKAVTDAGGAS